MSMRSLLLATLLAGSAAMAGMAIAQDDRPRLGRPATPAEIESWDITVAPDGEGLPHGSGTARQGEAVYVAKCQGCHGEKGKGGPNLALVGGKGSIGSDKQIKSIGSFWPYATTIFDYVFTSMPYQETKSLTHDETYAVTAYLLYINEIIGETDVIDAKTLPKVRMPYRDKFIMHITE
jgi:S-disulfanyl-L-cysteine oxidoreductase SoxD